MRDFVLSKLGLSHENNEIVISFQGRALSPGRRDLKIKDISLMPYGCLNVVGLHNSGKLLPGGMQSESIDESQQTDVATDAEGNKDQTEVDDVQTSDQN